MADAVIETARLTLRPLLFSDIDVLFEAIDSSRAALARWLPWERLVKSPADLRVFVDKTMKQNREGAAHRGVFEKDGRLAGHISVEDVRADLKAGDLGYWVRTDRAGKGLATEAARALVRWAFRNLDLHRLSAYADLENAGSLRVLEKTGFRREGIVRDRGWADGRWRDQALYGLLESEAL